MMRLKPFFIKHLTLFLLMGLVISVSANTMVIEKEISVNGVKPTFEINKKKDFKWMPLSIDFQKVLPLEKAVILNATAIKIPSETPQPKVVIDDVVVFLDAGMNLEGMMVYNGHTNLISPSSYLPTHSPG